MPNLSSSSPKRVMLFGATGTIGRAVLHALLERGHEVVCFLRPQSKARRNALPSSTHGAEIRYGEITDPVSVARDGFRDQHFDAVVSCMASRTGAPKDAWDIDYRAHVNALSAARDAGVTQFVLLSAICLQKPMLEFQRAKLAFEAELIGSGVAYSIVRPTAFFKSLSGQVDRLKRGKPFLIFGDGGATACKPIGDTDLARYLVDCLDDVSRRNRILPVGGPGEAITPRQQGEILFALLGREPKFKSVPVAFLDGVIRTLSTLGVVSSKLGEKAELARIGRYYATESMLLWDPSANRYDAAATPSYGSETLAQFYARLLRGEVAVDRGDHAVF